MQKKKNSLAIAIQSDDRIVLASTVGMVRRRR